MLPIDVNIEIASEKTGININLPEKSDEKPTKIAKNLNTTKRMALTIILMATVQQLKKQDDRLAEQKTLEKSKKIPQKRNVKYIGVRSWKFDN